MEEKRKKEKKRAPIYLWTGNGWGKTTSAIGAAIRASGHGYKVIIIQFMKGRKEKIGEYRQLKKMKNIKIFQFGRPGWVNLKNPSKKDIEIARKGFEFTKKIVMKEKPFLLVLDEINLATRIKLIDVNELIDFLKELPASIHVYLTGRYAPKELIDFADYVNTIEMLKGPKKLIGEKGIDY